MENPLLEKDSHGYDIGRHPDTLTESECTPFESSWKLIRAKCMDCCNENWTEVRHCTVTSCPLWQYRMGAKPKVLRKPGPVQRT